MNLNGYSCKFLINNNVSARILALGIITISRALVVSDNRVVSIYISKRRKGKSVMSKYNALWEYVKNSGSESFKLSFEEIEEIASTPIDHSFLKYKKELEEYGYQVGKISMKEQTVTFNRKND